MRESAVEDHLVKRVRELGGEVRKVQWIGRRGAPDRFVMLPGVGIWVELKNPDTILTFPAGPHERAQHREHERMRALGQRVEVVGTIEEIEEILR